MEQLPNLFIIGAAKCGTTSLAHYLSQHPQIFVPKMKECHFFDIDASYNKGLNYYVRSHFNGSLSYKIRCDASPSYIFLNKVPPRIRAAYGNAADNLKFIVMVRDPVDRAWSHYLHCCRIGVEGLSFERALEAEQERLRLRPEYWCGYYRDGRYGEQLAVWLESFGRENFLILRLDQLQQNRDEVLDSVCKFLKIAPLNYLSDHSVKNKAGFPRSKFIARWLSKASFINKISKVVLPRKTRAILVTSIQALNYRAYRDDECPRINAQTQENLRKKYDDDLAVLESIAGQSFSEWRCTK